MQPTQLFFALVALCATAVMAGPAPAGAVEARGFICDFLPQPAADDACSTVCKQEGNGMGGHCVDGTCTCLH
ncbi:hypothetical protein AGABI2DRAFT_194898 [Agaricus bisporus var. bisporus H97]|uniref:hypothetical protein n=1 Tax=Agaricus bisporus var. bisporus (strain H97 / ATCC MYA-4626 / FGSC 10389) TaxID=936046 RepID=UPI00029F71EC|nr:hypothetical protein AGABI2DRAFT_194884 [Agaricus bisporus var. bisporus H97]XP_006455257.1 hypothetical protein AGABI2DRAFT_194898 [Agaricus bisporus var. bisporus H97]EKV43982.1 hypothetical protein AGABI2DRAFT_194884 [Agaricus bisporus var. bisporus H97]EKV43992.1 hypothetical protein AGABI2DRAFT_194898 [Agaricus bisporus var. bisporus H97]